MSDAWLDAVAYDAAGLVPAIAQDAVTGRVLMLAWMDREALRLTRDTGEAHYWSRSRRRLWRKGEQSGHVQRVRELRLDCDADVVLLAIEQAGGIACHTGRARCFYRRLDGDAWVEAEPVLRDPGEIYRSGEPPEPGAVLRRLADTIARRRSAAPDSSYVASLFQRGQDAILKKVAEEAAETLLASRDGDRLHLTREVADLWFHSLLLLAFHNLGPDDVLAELRRREGVSGIDERRSRSP